MFGHNDFTLSKSTCGHECVHVTFPAPFQSLHSSETVHVQASVGFLRSSSPNHTVLSTWTEGVTERGFVACAARSGLIGTVELSVEWLAYVSPRRSFLTTAPLDGIQDALVSFSDFAAMKHCREETVLAEESYIIK